MKDQLELSVEELEERIAPDSENGVPDESNGNLRQILANPVRATPAGPLTRCEGHDWLRDPVSRPGGPAMCGVPLAGAGSGEKRQVSLTARLACRNP